jgi:hypothetical protein
MLSVLLCVARQVLLCVARQVLLLRCWFCCRWTDWDV